MKREISVNQIKAALWELWAMHDEYSPLYFWFNDERIEFPWVGERNKIISDEEAVQTYGVNNIRELIVETYHYLIDYYTNAKENDIDVVTLADYNRKKELKETLKDKYDDFVKQNIEYQKKHKELYSGLVIGIW